MSGDTTSQIGVSVEPELKARLDAIGPNRSAAARSAMLAGLPLVEASTGRLVPVILRGRWGTITEIAIELPEPLARVIQAYARDLCRVFRHFSAYLEETAGLGFKVGLVASLLDPNECGCYRDRGLPRDRWDAIHVLGRAVDALEHAVDATVDFDEYPGEGVDVWEGLETLTTPLDGRTVRAR